MRRASLMVFAGLLWACQSPTAPDEASPETAEELEPAPRAEEAEASGEAPVAEPAGPARIAQIAVESRPRGIAVSPDGVLAIALDGGELTFYQLPTAGDEVTLIRSRRLGGSLRDPVYLDGHWYVLEADGGSLLRVDLSEDGVDTYALDVGPGIASLWIDAPRRRAWVLTRGIADTPVAVIQLAEPGEPRVGEVVARLEGGTLPVQWAVGPEGNQLALPALASHEVRVFQVDPPAERAVFTLGDAPQGAAFIDEGRLAVIGQTEQALTTIELESAASTRVLLPGVPSALTVSDDTVWITYGGDGRVQAWDRGTFPDSRHERVHAGVLESAVPVGGRLWGAASSDADAMAGLRVITPTGVEGSLETGGAPSRIAVHGELAILMSPNEQRIDVVRVR